MPQRSASATGREWRGRQPGHEPGTPQTLHPALPQRLRGGSCWREALSQGGLDVLLPLTCVGLCSASFSLDFLTIRMGLCASDPCSSSQSTEATICGPEQESLMRGQATVP